MIVSMIRAAAMRDLSGLVDLEQRCFPGDRISRRGFRHLLTRGNACLLVVEDEGRVVACVVVLFRRHSAVARLYSIAIDPQLRGSGLAAALVHAAEDAARRHGATEMRLEVHTGNARSQRLFSGLGYERFARTGNYYADGGTALRYRRHLEMPPDEGSDAF